MEKTILCSLFSMVNAIELMALNIGSKASSELLDGVCDAILKHMAGARERLNILGAAYNAGAVPATVQGKPMAFDKIIAKKLGDALLQLETLAYGAERQTQNNVERKSFRTIGCNARNSRQRLDIAARASKLGSVVELTGNREATKEAIEARIDALKPSKVSKKT